jgi:hypothetical protein
MRLGMTGAISPFPVFYYVVQKENLYLHNTKIFYTGVYSGESEKVVFFDKVESCIEGTVASGITPPPTATFCYEADSVYVICRQVALLKLSMSERAHDGWQSFVFLSLIQLRISTILCSRKKRMNVMERRCEVRILIF